MITDAERQKVAANLRDSLIRCSRDDFGDEFEWFTETVCGPIDTLHQMELEDVIARLADLIDPDTTTNTTKSPELTTKCDRDALLALADEMFEDATGLALISQLENNEELQDLQSTMAKALMDYARRIRKALGVDDG